MRWDDLFADLEGQLAAGEAQDLGAEVADRTRREWGQLRLVDRLRPVLGAGAGVPLQLRVDGHGAARGTLLDAGPDWVLLQEGAGHQLLVAAHAVLALSGVGAVAEAPGSAGEVVRRLDLRWALRGLVRNRSPLQLLLRDGSALSGTLDRVGADHVDLAEHAPGEVRRAGAVRAVCLVPLPAISALRSGA